MNIRNIWYAAEQKNVNRKSGDCENKEFAGGRVSCVTSTEYIPPGPLESDVKDPSDLFLPDFP